MLRRFLHRGAVAGIVQAYSRANLPNPFIAVAPCVLLGLLLPFFLWKSGSNLPVSHRRCRRWCVGPKVANGL